MSNLQKLIENGGWLPIEYAPQNGSYFVVKHADGDFNVGLYEYGVPVVHNNGDYIDGGYGKNYKTKSHDSNSDYEPITHYMPLNTPEKLAKIVEVLLLAAQFGQNYASTQAAFDQIINLIEQAEKIAGE